MLYEVITVHVPHDAKERRLQKALLLYHLPEHRADVSEAIRICNRPDARVLLGSPEKRPPKGPTRITSYNVCYTKLLRMRIRKRNCCSSSVIENQYLISRVPEPTIIFSNSGTSLKNS